MLCHGVLQACFNQRMDLGSLPMVLALLGLSHSRDNLHAVFVAKVCLGPSQLQSGVPLFARGCRMHEADHHYCCACQAVPGLSVRG